MLVNLYFPELRELLDSLVAAIYKAQEIKRAFKRDYSSEQKSPEAAKRFSDALETFDEIGKLLQLAISSTSAKLLRPPSLFEKLKRSISGSDRKGMDRLINLLGAEKTKEKDST